MKNVAQVLSYYTGQQDNQKILYGEELYDSSVFPLQVIGKTKYVADKFVNAPMLTFQKRIATGGVDETFFVKGNWYYTATDLVLHRITDLSYLFGNQQIAQIVFTAVYYKTYHGLVQMVGVNDELYVTNSNNIFVSVGKLSAFIPENIQFITFLGSPLSPDYIAFDSEGKAYSVTISVNDNYVPTIVIGQTRSMPAILMCFKPTGCNVVHTDVSGQAQMNFVNSSYGLLSIRYASQTAYTAESSVFQVDTKDTAQIAVGTAYSYEIKTPEDSPSQVAISNKISNISDGIESINRISYNCALQQIKTELTRPNLSEPAHIFIGSQTIIKETQYLWESQQECAEIAAEIGKAFISQSSERIVQGQLSSYTYCNNYYYASHTMSTGEGIYYVSTTAVDGLMEEQETIQEQIMSRDGSGAPTLIKMVHPNGQTITNAKKYIYTQGNSTLPIAIFDGVTYNSQNKASAHYLGFEPYENFTISNSRLNNDYFFAENVELIEDAHLGTSSLRFKGLSYLRCTENFFIDENAIYQFTCYRKNSDADQWRYFEKLINGSDLSASRQIHLFTNGHSIANVTLKPIDCLSEIVIYEPSTFHLAARIDNTGIATRYVEDRLGRIQFSYKEKLIADESSSESYYIIDDKYAITNCNIPGYSRFNGYNCVDQGAYLSEGYNSACKVYFRCEGEFVSINGESEINKPTAVVIGAWARQGQQIKFVRGDNTIEVRFNHDTVSLYKNSILQVTSESAAMERSGWIILAKRNLFVVILNGKIILSQMVDGTYTISRIQVLENPNNSTLGSACIIAKEYDLEENYLDYYGNVIQTQRLRNDSRGALRIVTNANVFDSKGNLSVETLRASYPNGSAYITSSDGAFKYRSNFAVFDWSDLSKPRGVLTGELKDYYQNGDGTIFVTSEDDYNWPYLQKRYEYEASNRLLSTVWPGSRGESSFTSHSYHSPDAFKALVSKYFFISDVNYVSNGNRGMNANESFDFLQLHEMIQNPGQGSSKMIEGRKGESEEQSLFCVQNGITSMQSPYTAVGHIRQLRSPVNSSVLRNSISVIGSYRIHTNYGLDYSTRTILYDSYGNARLAAVSGQSYCIYAKYDRRNRIIESGTIQIPTTDSIITYYDAVNNPNWPQGSSIHYDSLYEYFYDTRSGSDIFSRGRLTSVLNVAAQTWNIYSYDYLGRANYFAYGIAMDEQYAQSVLKYTFDCADCIRSIAFPTETGISADYEYDEFGRVSTIILRKDGGGNTTVFSNAKYDLYDRLIQYSNSESIQIYKKYDLYANLVEMGEVGGKMLSKSYQDSISPYRLTSVSGTGLDTTTFTYDAFGWLASMQRGTLPLSYLYDYSGNLLSFAENGTQFFCEYNGNQLRGVRRSDDTVTALMTYDNTGALTTYSHSMNLTFSQDSFYAGKVSQIHLSGLSNIYHQYTYDWRGRSLRKTDLLPSANHSFSAYGYNGQLSYEHIGATMEIGKLYIYLGNMLLCTVDPRNMTRTDLVYDQANILRYIGYRSDETYFSTFVQYSNPWGRLGGQINSYRQAKYIYAGMEYLWDFNIYQADGAIYVPEYGVSGSPSIEAKHLSPYRVMGNDPMR